MKTANVFSILASVMLILISSLLATSADAQNANAGTIRGTVTDSTGAVIPSAKVTILNVQTGVKTSWTTNSVGIYDAPSLPAGEYSITFSANGFRTFVRRGIVLNIGTIAIDATLQVGTASQAVTVTAQTPLLQTVTPEQDTTLSSKTVTSAPIVGGVWYNELTTLLPGTGGGNDAQSNASTGEGVTVNGSRAYDIDFFMDGMNSTAPRDNNVSNFYPPIDSIAEVSAKTSGAGVQYGNGVASINVGIKSGTNQFHGSAYEFVQNSIFNAKGYFNPGPKAPVHWNEYGGSVGGPIVKNKLFFFFNYQRNPIHSAYISHTTVPTAAERAGNFSDPEFTATIYNRNSCSGDCARTPLNGGDNILLPSQESQVALNEQNLLPPPQSDALFNNYTEKVNSPSLSTWYVDKEDWQINEKQRLSGSFFMLPGSYADNPGSFDPNCVLGDCTQGGSRNTAVQVSETWTINPKMVNVVHIGGSREYDFDNPGGYDVGDVKKVGLEPAYGTNAPGDMLPQISTDAGAGTPGYSIFGGYHAYLAEGTYSASDLLTADVGRHTLSMGGEWDRYYQNQAPWGDIVSGAFTFSGIGNSSGTSIDPRTGTTTSGIPYADFLMGNVEQWSALKGVGTSAYATEGAAFIQDQYQMRQHLTISAGLRYTYQTGWGVAYNKFSEFDPTLTNPATNTPGALLFGGHDGYNSMQQGISEWAPRIGVAWSPFRTWVFHGSYGIFDIPRDAETFTDGALGTGLNTQGGLGGANTIIFALDSGPPAGSVVYPTPANSSPALLNGQTVSTYWPNSLPVSYEQQVDVNVEHQMPGSWMMQTSYVFTKGTNLQSARDLNQVKNLGSGIRPYPQYQSIEWVLMDGRSNYNALQLRAARRYSNGISFLFNYAWSKLLDTGTTGGHGQGMDYYQNAYDLAANYSIGATDVAQNFNGSISYNLPFGSTQRFKLRGIADQVVGGWRLDSILAVRSGVAFTPTAATDTSGSLTVSGGGYHLLPNRIGSGRISNPTINKWFDPAAFTLPAPDTFGNSKRNILFGPHYGDVDLSLGKSFPIYERMSLQVRADATDMFNHPNFATPDATISSSSSSTSGVGVITGTIGSASRTIQMGTRLTF